MNRLRLEPIFRRRMIPLVLTTALIVAIAAPAAFYAQKARELSGEARVAAGRVAALVSEAARERPRLWRYDSAKLLERIAAEGLDRVPRIVIHDAHGAEVLSAGKPDRAAKHVLWARAAADDDRRLAGEVWVAVDLAPLIAGTVELSVGFAVLAALLAAVLFLVPMRTIRSAERRIETLMGQLALTLQEEDRRRIARDLHDGAGQALTAARLQLLALRKHGPESKTLDQIAAHLDEALDEVRRSTTALLPPALAELGLRGAIERHCCSFADAAGLAVHCELEALPAMPMNVETALYRIVQEALNNTARHAGATSAWVRLEASGGSLRLEVGDDGVGLTDAAIGLDAIRDRARLVGGTVRVVDGDRGVRVQVTTPIGDLAS